MYKLAGTNTPSHNSRLYINTPRLGRKLLITLITAIIAVTATSLGALGQPAYASATGSGRVCIFFAPSGAPISGGSSGGYFGHVGWAFRNGQQDDWIYGATNGTGAVSIPPGGYNGAWIAESNWNTMIKLWAGNPSDPNSAYVPSGYYTQYRCLNTHASNVVWAQSEAYDVEYNFGYNIPIYDCLGDALQVLNAYDSSMGFLSDNSSIIPEDRVIPTDWFSNTLTSEGWEDILNLPAPSSSQNTPSQPPASSPFCVFGICFTPSQPSSSSQDTPSQPPASNPFCVFGICL